MKPTIKMKVLGKVREALLEIYKEEWEFNRAPVAEEKRISRAFAATKLDERIDGAVAVAKAVFEGIEPGADFYKWADGIRAEARGM